MIEIENLTPENENNCTPSKGSIGRRKRPWYLHIPILHIVAIAVYAIPLFGAPNRKEEAVLDEQHIVNAENKDVNGPTTWTNVFTDDYWGRPLTYHSSHKSWRPLSILSFRYLRGMDVPRISDLSMHRLVNVLTHAAAAELVGTLAVKLLAPESDASWLHGLTKLCFALHPTHVEVVANAANRPHIVATLLAVYASDPATPWLLFLLSIVAALLAAETALFQVVPIATTLVAISYVQRFHGPHRRPPAGNMLWQVVHTVRQPPIFLRLLGLCVLAVTYYGGRWYYDTLSIPEGLIRPAENPFFTLQGWTRVYSYGMVVGVHLYKQWDWDYVGFSHEYGRACLDPVEQAYDVRLLPAALMFAVLALVGMVLLLQQIRRRSLSKGLILYVVTLSWTVTLFPISGIVKVGTFIADRIVVASTVPVAIVHAYAMTSWLQWGAARGDAGSRRRCLISTERNVRKFGVLSLLLVLSWQRIDTRARQWMNSITLMESSLRSCPRFAKGHLETSKIYSGLYQERYNLTRARWHLQQAAAIDPDFCDVHHQFALLEAREGNHIAFEERLLNAVQCAFTSAQAQVLWHQYWPQALDETNNTPEKLAGNKARYDAHMAVIAAAIEAQAAQEKAEAKKSPLAVHWGSNKA
jgi:hypothetical protein